MEHGARCHGGPSPTMATSYNHHNNINNINNNKNDSEMMMKSSSVESMTNMVVSNKTALNSAATGELLKNKRRHDETFTPITNRDHYAWSCDVCKEYTFKTYEEAEAHEKICSGPDLSQLITNKTITALSTAVHVSPSSLKPNMTQKMLKKIPLLSPILDENGSDLMRNSNLYQQLSTYHHVILQSLNLLYHYRTGVISFQCHYCLRFLPFKQGMAPSWNVERIAELLPNMVVDHLLEQSSAKACHSFPMETRCKLKSVLKSSQERHPWTVQLIQRIFQELDIQERQGFAPNFNLRLVYLPVIEAQSGSGAISARKQLAVEYSKKRVTNDTSIHKNHSVSKSLSNDVYVNEPAYPLNEKIKYGNMGAKHLLDEYGNSFLLTPSNGIPLICSLTSQESKNLSIPMQILLQQLEFFDLSSMSATIQSEVRTNLPPAKAVGIRCQNCVTSVSGCAFLQLTCTNNIASDIQVINSFHLRYCRFIDNETLKILKQINIDGTDVCELLSNYCNFIVELYCLQNLKGDPSMPMVTLGECPTIPSGYTGCPKDINLDFILNKHATTNL